MSDPLDRVRFLIPFIRPWRMTIFLSLIALVVTSAANLLFPWLLKLMVDSFGRPNELSPDLPLLAAGLVAAFVLSALGGYYQQISFHRLGLTLRNDLRRKLYHTLLKQSLAFHRKEQVGELSSRATEDLGKIQHLFTSLLAPIVQNSLVVTGGLTLTLLINPAASVVLIVFLLLPAPFVLRFSRKIRALAAESQTHHATANAHFEESLVAIREVKALAREEREEARYHQWLQKALAVELSSAELFYKGSQAAYFLLAAMLLLIFYLGGTDVFPGWTLGGMVAFYFYAYTIAMGTLSIGRVYLVFQNIAGALERVEELLHERPDQDLQTGEKINIQGQVQISGVSFSYENEVPVFNDLSLEVVSGDWIVISGPSGSGKSTIANLLLGFYRPGAGSILYDGVSLKELDLPHLRRQIGFVGQDPFLFHGSIRDNLMLTPEADDARLRSMLRVACLAELVDSLPEKLDTPIGERGYTLSGGQKARLAIARAVGADPPILILDEASAMLEPELEGTIWANLLNLRGSRTTIILSHHFGNIPRIDRFYKIAGHTLVHLPSPVISAPR